VSENVAIALIGAGATVVSAIIAAIAPIVLRQRERRTADTVDATTTWGLLKRHPRASVVIAVAVGSLVLGILTFLLILRFASQADHQPPDSDEQRQARAHLYEFFRLAAQDTYRDTIHFSNDIHTRLGAGKGFDMRQTLGGMLKNYAESDFAVKFTALARAMPPSGKHASFVELSHRFEQFFCSYDKLVFWTQRAALLVPINPPNDSAYQQWAKTDADFLSRLRETLAKPGFDYLRGQINGCRQSFRLRDSTNK
jgi:hypothetical protein